MLTTSAEAPDGSFSESIPAIAHDLNNNMQMVLSALDLMRCCLAQGRPADTAPYVERAVAFAERVTKLGRRLMRSRDCVDTRFAGVNVKSTIEKMRPIVSQIAGVSVKLSLSLADDLRPVSCDSLDFENALLNLVLNARDAMPAGGRLRVETSKLFVDKAPLRTGPYVVITVTDTGIGMTPTSLATRSIPTLRPKRPDAAPAWAPIG
jgi:signal transduction histidine kinase